MKKGQYLKGMFCLLLVNGLLVASSVLTKEILGDANFQKPLLLTYLSAAMYIGCLVPYLPFICSHCTTLSKRTGDYSLLVANSRSLEVSADNKVALPIRNEMGKGQKEKPLPSAEASVGITSCFCFVVKQSAEKIPLLKVVKLSGIFGSVLFGMNYLFNASMVYTSQGSSTAVSTLSGPFCLIFSTVFLKEPLVWSNTVGVAMVFGGSFLISYLDSRSNDEGLSDEDGISDDNGESKLIGDFYAITSAFVYGLYSTLMKFCIKDDSRLSMFLYLGLAGLWNVICLWPFFFLFDYFKWEEFKLPDNMNTIRFILLNGFISLIFEVCWTRSILLLSPVLTSVGLGLSVPLSLIVDYFYYKKSVLTYYLAAVGVVAGFVLANVKTRQSLEPNSDIQKPVGTEELLKDKETC